MKSLVIFLLLTTTAMALVPRGGVLSIRAIYEEIDESLEEFEKEFNLIENDEAKAEGAKNLKKAEQEINEVNKEYAEGKKSFKEALYDTSDLSKKQFEKEKEGLIMPEEERFGRTRGIIMPPESERNSPENDAKLKEFYSKARSLPSAYDARTLGYITEPKNQGSCGSCAAFAAHGLHEACFAKAGAKLDGLNLSEQELIDCGYDGYSMNGCNGAHLQAYTKWFSGNGGEGVHEANQMYLDRDPTLTCPHIAKWQSGAKMTDYIYDYECNEEKMMQMIVEHGAAMGALYASDFQNYKQGIFSGCSSQNLNHGVLFVGFGEENGEKYWIIKNSWGKHWGESGYLRLRRGTNECGSEKICLTAKCSSTGVYEAPPPIPTLPPPPPNQLCDVSRLFGPITGTFNIRMIVNGVLYDSLVKCDQGTCTPANPGPSNACVYICGKEEC